MLPHLEPSPTASKKIVPRHIFTLSPFWDEVVSARPPQGFLWEPIAALLDLTPEGKPAVTTKSDFTEDEWSRIVRAPFVAGMAITLADPGGPIEATKETLATLKSATNPPSREQLLAEVALEIQAMTQQKQSPLGGYRPAADGPPAGVQVLEELRAVQTLVATKAQPDEAAAFGQWLVAAARAAADAAKEGGFMGFGAQQVSDREEAMLNQVRAAVSG